MIAKYRWEWTDKNIERRRYIDTGRQTIGHKNELGRWTPTLVIVIVIVIISSIKTIEYKYKNLKRPADDRTDGRTGVRTYYTSTQVIWPCGLRPHALHVIMGCANALQKATRMTRQRYRDAERQRDIPTDRRTYKLDWTSLGSSGLKCGDKLN